MKIVLPVPTKAFLQVSPRTALLFAPFSWTHLSHPAEPIHQGHCWKLHHEAESFAMSYEVIGLGTKTYIPLFLRLHRSWARRTECHEMICTVHTWWQYLGTCWTCVICGRTLPMQCHALTHTACGLLCNPCRQSMQWMTSTIYSS